jgi:hypothetical protein
MKTFSILIIILLVVAAVFFFTKPSDAECMAKAKATVDASALAITPGYDNPMEENTVGKTPPEALRIKDKFLWKEVEYTLKGEIKTVGYGYLGSFHPVKNEKKQDL